MAVIVQVRIMATSNPQTRNVPVRTAGLLCKLKGENVTCRGGFDMLIGITNIIEKL